MADEWISPAQAAERLRISERTVWRRMKTGELQSQQTPGGKRQVLIEAALTPSDSWHDALTVVQGQADRQIQLAGAAIGQARELADHLKGEVRRTRRWGAAGWALVALLTVAGGGASWWASRALTMEGARADRLTDKLTDTADRLDSERGTVEALRGTLSQAQGDAQQLHADLTTALTDLAGAAAEARILAGELERARATTRPAGQGGLWRWLKARQAGSGGG